MAFQFFISYARDDDTVPPSTDGAKGFITALRENLAFEFRDKGGIVPEMWWDRRKIAPHEQFDPVIQEGIDRSDLLLVILSRNWLASEYCKHELDLFAKRWGQAPSDERALKERIWIVSKQFIDYSRRPPLLAGQSSYEFYSREKTDEEGTELEFFRHGKPQAGYDDVIRALAQNLWKRAQASGTAPASKKVSPTPAEPASPQPPPAKRRVIYVAKPASDMRSAYARIVEELSGREYDVRPTAAQSVPVEDARAFVENELGDAEASIHLLGEQPGGQPDGCPPIVQLQLELAAKRAAANDDFKRIIWAPKAIVADDGSTEQREGRDPLAVLKKFGAQIPSDKVDGSEISAFVEFVVQHLERIAPLPDVSGKQLAAGDSVYLDFSEKDWEYAEECMTVLDDRNIVTSIPAFDKEEPRKTEAVNRKKMQNCDAVVLCWAKAPDNWFDAREEMLAEDAAKLGRAKPFALRALIAGPPPNLPAKKLRLKRKQSKGIDVTLDLTDHTTLPPDALDPLISKL